MLEELWKQILAQGCRLPADPALRGQVCAALGCNPKIAGPWHIDRDGEWAIRDFTTSAYLFGLRDCKDGEVRATVFDSSFARYSMKVPTADEAKAIINARLADAGWVLMADWPENMVECRDCGDRHCTGGIGCRGIPF